MAENDVFAFCLMTTGLFVTMGDEEKVRMFLDNRNRLRSDRRSKCYWTGPGAEGVQEHVLLCAPSRRASRSPVTISRFPFIAPSTTAIPPARSGAWVRRDTAEGQQIHSRYYPVKSYAVCANNRPWAWCLDKPCIIDKNNPEAAACTCDVVKNLGAYVIVTTDYTPATCTTGVISSATVPQIDQATASLKKAKVLPPFPIRC